MCWLFSSRVPYSNSSSHSALFFSWGARRYKGRRFYVFSNFRQHLHTTKCTRYNSHKEQRRQELRGIDTNPSTLLFL